MSELKEFTLKIQHEKDHIWVEVEELPGCFASGADIDELREALAEAIGMYLSDDVRTVQIRNLDFVPPPEMKQVPIRARLVAA